MSNRASKGSAFEREICRRLSLWWTQHDDNPRDDLFWRTSNSGGRATVNKSRIHCGDVCAIDPVGQPLIDIVSFEIKRGYNRATAHDILDKPKNAKLQTYEEWIIKAERVRKQAGAKAWAVIHKRDRREAIVIVPNRGPFSGWTDINPSVSSFDFTHKRESYFAQIGPLCKFFACFDPRDLTEC